MAQIVMVVTSIDTLAAYKVSDDLILDSWASPLPSMTIQKVLQWVPGGFRLSNLTNWLNINRREGTCSTTAKSK
jgi:hypothetical protein